MSLNHEQIQELKEDLLTMKRDLEKQEDAFEEPANSDELSSIDNHLADSANGVVSREEAMAEKTMRENRLHEVEEALERIEEGKYGICVDSGEEIPYERLKAVPYAKRTVAAEEALGEQRSAEPANGREATSQMERPEEETGRERTMERLQEEHNHREKSGDFEEENRW